MRMLPKNGALPVGAALAVCAFAVPSMASAASWGVIGTTHTLDSPNLSFIAHLGQPPGQVLWTCLQSQFHVDVANATALRITAATMKSCSTVAGSGNCTVTATPTRFPWTVTGTTTTNIQVESLLVDFGFETRPGGAPGSCGVHNQNTTWTGTLNGGVWDATTHAITLIAATGSVLHSAFGATTPAPTTVMGTIQDTSQSLTLT